MPAQTIAWRRETAEVAWKWRLMKIERKAQNRQLFQWGKCENTSHLYKYCLLNILYLGSGFDSKVYVALVSIKILCVFP